MFCLKCEMQMEKTIYKNVLIDYCFHCHGIWIDGNELKNIKKDSKTNIESLIKKSRKEKIDEKTENFISRFCPRCKIGTIKEVKENNILIDKCNECNGIFFDNKEIKEYLKNLPLKEKFILLIKKYFI